MSRTSNDQFNAEGVLFNGYDYARQCWVIGGKFAACGHSSISASCWGCNHAGEDYSPTAIVLPSHRFAINTRIVNARALDPRDIVAGVENVACYWESFPNSYPAEKVAAAIRLIVADPGTKEYESALVAVARILREQGSLIGTDRIGA